jgi:hypothetical protein
VELKKSTGALVRLGPPTKKEHQPPCLFVGHGWRPLGGLAVRVRDRARGLMADAASPRDSEHVPVVGWRTPAPPPPRRPSIPPGRGSTGPTTGPGAGKCRRLTVTVTVVDRRTDTVVPNATTPHCERAPYHCNVQGCGDGTGGGCCLGGNWGGAAVRVRGTGGVVGAVGSPPTRHCLHRDQRPVVCHPHLLRRGWVWQSRPLGPTTGA